MTLKKKILSIALSIAVAVTFMPITNQIVFAAEDDIQETAQPESTFNPGGAVSGLTVAGFNYKSVTIGWSPYEKAAGYQVYSAAKKKGRYKRVCTTAGLAFYDKKNKKLGKSRYYKIRAYGTVDGRTVYTGFSGVLTAKPNLNEPVAWTTASSNKITVSWNKVYGASKYQVYRSTNPYGKYKKLTTTKRKSYTGKAVSKNVRYYYKIRAKRGSKKGYFCRPVEGITTLSAPGTVTASNNINGGINVSWSGVANAAGYQLFRSTSFNGGFEPVTSDGIGSTSYLDTNSLTDGVTYFYKVRAYAIVNGNAQYGYMSSGSGRDSAVAQAAAWIGCRESNGSHKGIVNIYNSATSSGKIGYKTAWCAAFVSAVGVASGNSSVIPVDSYCPRMLKKFKNGGSVADRNFAPNGGDVIFYDWNGNNVPDHVGMIYYRNNDQITTIEGNYSDSVKCRTFTRGWSKVQAYGLPAYVEQGKITYSYTEPDNSSASADVLVEDPVNEAEVQEAVNNVETGEATELQATEESQVTAESLTVSQTQAAGQEAEQAAEQTAGQEAEQAAEQTIEQTDPAANDQDKVEALMNYIEEEKPAEESSAEESTYNAFLMFKACENMGIDACVVTEITSNGEEKSYNEVEIDGELFTVDASEEGSTPVKYIPEEIN